jgi:hypothetical protein
VRSNAQQGRRRSTEQESAAACLKQRPCPHAVDGFLKAELRVLQTAQHAPLAGTIKHVPGCGAGVHDAEQQQDETQNEAQLCACVT